MKIDVQDRRLAWLLVNHVLVPDAVEERLRHEHSIYRRALICDHGTHTTRAARRQGLSRG
jgi:hypothetical protein